MEGTASDDPTIIGDECHIVSRKCNGPRGSNEPSIKNYDRCSNLILLCKVHHKMIDDQVETYTTEFLTKAKAKHEDWVRNSLNPVRDQESEILEILGKISSGKELMNISAGCLAYMLDHDEIDTELESDTIGSFLQNVQDWSEIWDSVEISERIRVQGELSKQISELDCMGFSVFAKKVIHNVKVFRQSHKWPVFLLVIARKTNQGITPIGDLIVMVKGW